MIILLSVPHTGTRFTMAFLDSIKVLYRQYHTERSMVDEIRHESSKRAVIPVRDPLLAYTSSILRSSHYPDILDHVSLNYKLLMEMETWFEEIQYLKLNAEDRELELKTVAEFCGHIEPVTFEWEPVGNLKPSPTSYSVWDIISDHLPEGEKGRVLETLQPFREYYGYGG